MKTQRYGLFDLYTKVGSEYRYVKREGAYYSIPVGFEIEPFTKAGRCAIIDRIYDGTFPVFVPNPSMVSDLSGYLKMKGYEARTFNANAY